MSNVTQLQGARFVGPARALLAPFPAPLRSLGNAIATICLAVRAPPAVPLGDACLGDACRGDPSLGDVWRGEALLPALADEAFGVLGSLRMPAFEGGRLAKTAAFAVCRAGSLGLSTALLLVLSDASMSEAAVVGIPVAPSDCVAETIFSLLASDDELGGAFRPGRIAFAFLVGGAPCAMYGSGGGIGGASAGAGASASMLGSTVEPIFFLRRAVFASSSVGAMPSAAGAPASRFTRGGGGSGSIRM